MFSRYLHAENAFSAITIFEQREEVGGVWCYTSHNAVEENFAIPHTKPTTTAEKPVHTQQTKNGDIVFQSPVYDFLETNIPHTLMGYSDWKFPKGTSLFPSHQAVKQYLQGYAKELLSSIVFHTQVVDVRLQDDQTANSGWKVSVQDLRTQQPSTHDFDAVVVASGHYNDHYIPDIAGLREWNEAYPNSISHSKHYRRPEQYTNQVSFSPLSLCAPLIFHTFLESSRGWKLSVRNRRECANSCRFATAASALGEKRVTTLSEQ